jgi:hypothetical protein
MTNLELTTIPLLRGGRREIRVNCNPSLPNPAFLTEKGYTMLLLVVTIIAAFVIVVYNFSATAHNVVADWKIRRERRNVEYKNSWAARSCSFDCYDDGGCPNCSDWHEWHDADYGNCGEWRTKDAPAPISTLGPSAFDFYFSQEVTQMDCDEMFGAKFGAEEDQDPIIEEEWPQEFVECLNCGEEVEVEAYYCGWCNTDRKCPTGIYLTRDMP